MILIAPSPEGSVGLHIILTTQSILRKSDTLNPNNFSNWSNSGADLWRPFCWPFDTVDFSDLAVHIVVPLKQMI